MSVDHSRIASRGLYRQQGWGLLELMVAVTIGLFVLFGLFSMLYNMTVANTSQSQFSGLEDNQRVVMSVLENVVQQAGYVTVFAANSGAITVLPASSTPYWNLKTGQGIAGSTAATSDTITVSYVADDPNIIGCLGASNSTGATGVFFINQFTVQNNNLICNFSSNGTTVASGVVASGVASISVLYGVDVSHSTGSVDTYMTANGVAAQTAQTAYSATPWDYVRTAQITVNFLNPLYSAASGAVSAQQFVPVTRTVNLMNKFVQGPS
jgi:type IV pilus assembly protein PilW